MEPVRARLQLLRRLWPAQQEDREHGALRVERREKPYVLSEPEEQALNARRPTVAAWQALHDRHVSTLEVPFDAGEGEQPHTISQLLSYFYRPDRDIRVRAVNALFSGLAPRADVLAACYDALVGDRLSTDRLRGYANPMQPTNLANELDDDEIKRVARAISTTVRTLQRRGGSHTGDHMPAREPGGHCPRDGAEMLRRTVGGRTTYSCPVHQR